MVKSFNAFATNRAMSGSACSNDFAIRAQRGSIEHFQQAHEFQTLFSNVTRVSESNDEIQNKHKSICHENQLGQQPLLVWTDFGDDEEQAYDLENQEEIKLSSLLGLLNDWSTFGVFSVNTLCLQNATNFGFDVIVLEILNVIHGNVAIFVFYIRISSFHQQSSNRTSALQFLNASHRQVKRSVSFFVSCVHVWIPSQQVRQRRFGLRVASPQQRRAAPLVRLIEIEPQHFEEVQRRWVISLTSNVQHIQQINIQRLYIGLISQKYIYSI